MNYLITFREFVVNNFSITLKSVEKNNYKYYNSYLFYVFKIIPFFFIKLMFSWLNIKYIYLIDNIYVSNYGDFRITPTILNVFLLNDENDTFKINFTTTLLKYNGTVPFWYIIENEKITNFQKIQFKYFSKGKMENKTFDILEINNKLLYEIF
jgi:hypothetical protein